MKKFIKGIIVGLGFIVSLDIINEVIMDNKLTKKREKFYEENGF